VETARLMGIDHVIAGVAPPDLAAAVLAGGLEVVPGGDHTGLGTSNALVGLAGAYVELIAVRDPAEAAASRFMGSLPALLADGPAGWVGLALRTGAPDALAARLRDRGHDVELLPGRRRRLGAPDAHWTMVAVDGPPWGRARPFAIAWGSAPVRGAAGGPDLAGVVLEVADPEAEAAWWCYALGAVPAPGADHEVVVGAHRVALRPGSRGLARVLVTGIDSPVTLPGGAVLQPAP